MTALSRFLPGSCAGADGASRWPRSSARAAISRTALARVRSRSLSRIYRLWGGLLSGAAPRAAAASRAAQGAAPLTGDDPAALAEADARETVALAVTAQSHLVAVFQKLPNFAGRQADRFSAALGQFEQAAAFFRQRSRHSAAGPQ